MYHWAKFIAENGQILGKLILSSGHTAIGKNGSKKVFNVSLKHKVRTKESSVTRFLKVFGDKFYTRVAQKILTFWATLENISFR